MRCAAALVAAFVCGWLTGCGTAATSASVQRVSGAWYLTGATVEGQLVIIDPLRRITLVTDPQVTGDDDAVAGYAGCNWYGTTLTYDDEGLHVDGVGQTAMGCQDDQGRRETSFLVGLAAVDHAEQGARSLLLTGPRVAMRFAPIPAIDLDAVIDRPWVLESLVTGDVTSADAVVEPARGKAARLKFTKGMQLSATTGCGQLSATWQPFLGDLRVTESSVTGAESCVVALLPQHNAVVSALSDFTPTTDGDRLLIQSHDGTGLVYRLDQSQG